MRPSTSSHLATAKKQFYTVDIANPKHLAAKIHQYRANKAVTQYKKIRKQGVVYTTGDAVELRNVANQSRPFVAKLISVIKLQDNQQKQPLLEVHWYYRKENLPKNFEKKLHFFSENELFETEHVDFVPASYLIIKPQILSLQQYEARYNVEDHTYFTRASLDISNSLLSPPTEDMHEWPRICVCKQPSNPDLEYVQCQRCQEWFHQKCTKYSSQQLRHMHYYCKRCE